MKYPVVVTTCTHAQAVEAAYGLFGLHATQAGGALHGRWKPRDTFDERARFEVLEAKGLSDKARPRQVSALYRLADEGGYKLLTAEFLRRRYMNPDGTLKEREPGDDEAKWELKLAYSQSGGGAFHIHGPEAAMMAVEATWSEDYGSDDETTGDA